MQLKKNKANSSEILPSLFSEILNRSKGLYLSGIVNGKLFLFVMLFLILLVGFLSGVLLQRNYSFSNLFAKPIILDSFGIVKRKLYSQFVSPEVLTIDIKHNNYMKLQYTRDKAIREGTIFGIQNDWVNVRVRYNKESYKAKIRLKGATADEHLLGEKWSFKLKLKGRNSILGMKEFSAMDPMRRNLLGQWFIREVYLKEGLISRKYEFVRVVINGEDKGIYVLDERYDKTMLARNERKVGPVLKLDQSPLFANDVHENIEKDNYYLSMDYTAFNKKKILNDNVLREQFHHAKYLMERFRLEELLTSEIFDVELMARWFAIADVLGAWHGFGFVNMRFYYNPITSKFEPVPDDDYNERAYNYAADIRLFRLNDQYNSSKFLRHVFSDNKFVEKYIKELERISDVNYIDKLFLELGEQIDQRSYILAEDYPFYSFLLDSKNNIYNNAKSLRKILNVQYGLQAHFKSFVTNSSISLDIANNQSIPIELLYITDGNTEIYNSIAGKKQVIDGKIYQQPVTHRTYKFSVPGLHDLPLEVLKNMEVFYRIVGTKIKKSTKIIPFPAFNSNYEELDFIRRKENIDNFPFLISDKKNKEIFFKKGKWVISEDMIIPEGYTVNVPAGVSIDLVNSAMILSYSPIFIIGAEDDFVSIYSSDKTGQGVTVIGATKKSLIKYTNFTSLSRPKKGRWDLTGAVNFYKSPVNMYQVSCLDNVSGDDYINIVKSKFSLSNVRIVNSYADALDIDFSKGSISKSVFLSCGFGDKGGDCIDFSGSQVEMKNISIDKVADKGVSIGEASKVTIDNLKIKSAKIAVAGKDESEVTITNLHVESSEVGVTAFNKKHQYGPSLVNISDAKMQSVKYPYLVDKKSSLTVDSGVIPELNDDLRQKFYDE